jgi:hypothetical protein
MEGFLATIKRGSPLGGGRKAQTLLGPQLSLEFHVIKVQGDDNDTIIR